MIKLSGNIGKTFNQLVKESGLTPLEVTQQLALLYADDKVKLRHGYYYLTS